MIITVPQIRINLRDEAWTEKEDHTIVALQQKGVPWIDISKQLRGRSYDQVRERFVNILDPERSQIKEWSEEELDRLVKAQKRLGNKWALMSKDFPGRTGNDLKNKFNSYKRAVLRQVRTQTSDMIEQDEVARAAESLHEPELRAQSNFALFPF